MPPVLPPSFSRKRRQQILECVSACLVKMSHLCEHYAAGGSGGGHGYGIETPKSESYSNHGHEHAACAAMGYPIGDTL